MENVVSVEVVDGVDSLQKEPEGLCLRKGWIVWLEIK